MKKVTLTIYKKEFNKKVLVLEDVTFDMCVERTINKLNEETRNKSVRFFGETLLTFECESDLNKRIVRYKGFTPSDLKEIILNDKTELV